MKSAKWFRDIKQAQWDNLYWLTNHLQSLLDEPYPDNPAWCEKLRLTLVSISNYNVPRD